MKTKTDLFAAGMLLTALARSFGQPIITHQPQNQTNVAGTIAMFSVGAAGMPPLSYQWRSHASATVFTNITWGTETTLLLTNVQPTTRSFGVVVSDAGGSVTSVLATLTVLVPPTITNQPTSHTVEVGEGATFSVGATGTAPLRYQWRRNDEDLVGKTNTGLPLTNVQFTNAGSYSVVVTNVAGSTTSQVATLTVLPPVFTKITNGSIVTNIGTGVASAWGDYDNDGFIDLIVTSEFDSVNRTVHKSILYHNNGDGTFTSVTNTPITGQARDWRGCSWVDYDNDGDLDLFVTSVDANGFAAENELFRNNGDGSFSKMTAAAVGDIVPGGGGGLSEGPIWADYDRDGFIDVYVVRFGADWLFHNNGDGTFAKVTNNIGIPPDNYDSYHNRCDRSWH